MPPITPGSAVSVIRSMTCSSFATAATPSGMPMPRLTTPLRLQLERGAAGDDLALAQRHRRDARQRHADLAGEGRVVGVAKVCQ